MTTTFRGFWHHTSEGIKKNERVPQFLVLIAFLAAFGFIRTVTHLQRAGILPNQHGGFHVHHMVPGIILLLISGYVGISFWRHPHLRRTAAVLFGIGAALTLDEFALWLFVKDVYWAKQGRTSVDAIFIAVTLLSLSFLVSEANGHKWAKRVQRTAEGHPYRPV